VKTRNVAILIFENAEVLDFAGPFEVFNAANEINGEKLFNVYTLSEDGSMVSARNRFNIKPDYSINNCPEPDILVIPGGVGRKVVVNNSIITGWVSDIFSGLEILLTVCTGFFIAAKAGVMNVDKAATHHGSYDELESSYPCIKLVRNVKYVDSGKIITAGGISAGINASLHIVDRLTGNDRGRKTAAHMEYDY
jgi:transcriptional regulator GlxA family with amidase domain